MHIGTVRSIWRFPVKSMAGEQLDEAEVLETGIAADRTSAFRIASGPQREGKLYRGKEDATLHLQTQTDAVVEHAASHGFHIGHVDDDRRYFDDSPISLIVDRWLDGVSKFVGGNVEPERFRPNFIVDAADSFSIAEPDLTGRMIGIGEVRLRVQYPIERCVVPNYDLHGGASDERILRYLAQARNAWMGIYCDVLRAGIARPGDSVDVVEA